MQRTWPLIRTLTTRPSLQQADTSFTANFTANTRSLTVALAAVLGVFGSPTLAQIATDGSVGSSPSATLTGPDYNIPADLGQVAGNNLLHSFSEFNINTGESATFTGPTNISNVLARVTGESMSNIDGLLRSSGMPNADFYLINPNGVMFGPNAQLDVAGSFVVTTANQIHLADGGRVTASVDPAQTVLTTAAPAAFGFLSDSPASVTIQGASLAVATGEAVSVVAGDVQIEGATVQAPSGRVNLVSVTSSGQVDYDVETHAVDLAPDAFETMGPVTVTGGSTVNVSGDPAGTVTVRGQSFLLEGGSNLVANTEGATDHAGTAVDIEIDGSVSVQQSVISVHSLGPGSAGLLKVTAGDMEVVGELSDSPPPWWIQSFAVSSGASADMIFDISGTLSVRDAAFIFSETDADGPGGDITVTAGRVEVLDLVQFATFSFGSGVPGVFSVTADEVVVSGEASGGTVTQMGSFTVGSADAGPVMITTDQLSLIDGGEVGSTSFGPSNAGSVMIDAQTVTINNNRAGFTGVTANSFGGGNAGSIQLTTNLLAMAGGTVQTLTTGDGVSGTIVVDASNVMMTSGAQILAPALSSGQGGNIDLTIADTLTLIGQSGISTETRGTGPAGDVIIRAGTLDIRERSLITANAFGGQGGDAGSLTIEATDIVITGTGEVGVDENGNAINTGLIVSTSELGGSARGEISVTATGRLEMSGRSTISAGAFGPGRGADVTLDVGELLITGGSVIGTNMEGAGESGNVMVTADRMVLSGVGQFVDLTDLGKSAIVTQAFGETVSGTKAGDIHVTTDSLELLDGAGLGADTFGQADGGHITINAGSVTVSGFDASLRAELANNPEEIQSASASIQTRSGRTLAGDNINGNAGNIAITADTLDINHEGIVFSGTSTPGSGGNIDVMAGVVTLSSGGTVSAASSLSAMAGPAGRITFRDFDRVALRSGSSITSAAESAKAGDITIGPIPTASQPKIGRSIEVFDSLISVESGVDGGNIKLTASKIVNIDTSTITARAVRDGAEIAIDAQVVNLRNSTIDGRSGDVPVKVVVKPDPVYQCVDCLILARDPSLPPELDLSASLVALPVSFLSRQADLEPHCAVQFGTQASSFTILGRGGTSVTPDGWLPSVDLAIPAPSSPALPPDHQTQLMD